MLERTTDERIADLEGQVKELTAVLSALVENINRDRSGIASWRGFWKKSFLKDLEVSDELKEKLGLIPDKENDEDDF